MDVALGRVGEPAEDGVVRPDHTGVRGRPDRQVQEAILEHHLVGLVVTLAGKAGDDVPQPAAVLDDRHRAAWAR